MHSLLRELDSLIRQGIVKLAEQKTVADSAEEAVSASPTSGTASGRTVRVGAQLSLFDSAPAVPVLDTVTDTAALPSCAGRPVAVTPAPVVDRSQHPGLCVAVGGASVTERIFGGDVRALVEWAAKAEVLVTPDLKRLLHQHPAWGVIEPARCFDLGLAAYLLAPEDRDYGWPSLSARHAEKAGLPLGRPGEVALSLYAEQAHRLEATALTPLFTHVEMPLIPVLASMEKAGITIDREALRFFLDEVQGELDTLTTRIYEEAGEVFNIRSAQQIGDVLFKKLGLSGAKSTRGGQASTSQAVLEKLSGEHPVVDALLEFRKLEKMRSTYLEPLPRLAGPDGRIHTTLNQTATATGRLSSSNPNLQNIPVRDALGKPIRAAFVASAGCW